LSFRIEGAKGGEERLTWQRGFVERVTCRAAEWLQHGGAVRKRNPVRKVALSACEQVTRDAWSAGLDTLRGLRRVDLLHAPGLDRAGIPLGFELDEWLRQSLSGTPVNMVIGFAF
jgi:hypothetical protein